MEIKVITFTFYLLFLQMGPSLTSPQILQMWKTVGESVVMPCDTYNNGDYTWKIDGGTYVRSLLTQKTYGSRADASRISFPYETTKQNNSMKLTGIRLGDSGNYSCDQKMIIILVIFEISVSPSTNLIVSEDLDLSIKTYSKTMTGLRTLWETPGRGNIEGKGEIKVPNVQITDGGTYNCRVWIDRENEATFPLLISVSGFFQTSKMIYIPKDSPAWIPWDFNFNVRETAVANGVTAVDGSISYSNDKTKIPSVISSLTVNSGACWPDRCREGKKEHPRNLSFFLRKPKTGWYHLEIQLKQGNRQKKNLSMDVCLVMLTVSAFPSQQLPLEAKVSLTCQTSCIDANSTLYWHHVKSNTEKHDQRGKSSFSWDLTAVPESMGVWICSVRVGGKIMLSNNITLELETTFIKSPSFVWVVVGGGAILILVGTVTIVLLAARCRRKRRARRGAWILQNLDQQRRCQCKGFAPTRLREKDWVPGH
ncbi:T-cell surface glycoprotein CD4 [Xenopus laevis]|uniref:T-cell surface glycoprotein CD4 n=1 Tax=Xenopus laevis TaxID=8355 RepID=A0A8J1L998_XENLA|nr:T-cell surface glycoprotein CD4 [Xenopus laevis]XP_018080536.1 T-cell surface glycoprotein CD4 [Xenopus laevis]XP_041426113.1 T-cell surface glycoprotein CD4 [Xenopus laevis]XP_041426114.1 T-cell surface glycoprotein CD4 [Xenopus laevis]XP_041426115.1 T-cell surface glycoprotein CD4 [Xenopus laevis]XP_041426116.1 T-cell surface glycoprotein CD4 [Xenopus laevis]XP_041426117.1 T-cell surface glycoprotein CD4 [Xenopus laevis]XP_041426118.1 T-cell surface glycoprotein CD4 [Xenopus laevis]XP_